jgi:hypothetical protein
MKVYGHTWSINTRKTLMTLAEKARRAHLRNRFAVGPLAA